MTKDSFPRKSRRPRRDTELPLPDKLDAIWTADAHVDDFVWNNRPIQGDSYFAFSQLVDLAIRYEADLIGAGDMLDRKYNGSGPIVFLARELRRLEDHGRKLYYIQGQHERQFRPWLEIGLDAVVHVHGTEFQVGNTKYWGLDYQSGLRLPEYLDRVPRGVDVLVCHQVWQEFIPVGNPQGSLVQVPHVKKILTGDYHVSCVRTLAAEDGRLISVYSPGSTCMQSINEPPVKSCFGVDSDGNVYTLPLRSRPVLPPVQITTDDELATVLESLPRWLSQAVGRDPTLPEQLRMPLWHVAYRTDVPDVEASLASATDGKVHVFWKPVRVPSDKANLVTEDLGLQLTLKTALPLSLSPVNDADAFHLASMLLDCDPAQLQDTLEQWFQTFMGESDGQEAQAAQEPDDEGFDWDVVAEDVAADAAGAE